MLKLRQPINLIGNGPQFFPQLLRCIAPCCYVIHRAQRLMSAAVLLPLVYLKVAFEIFEPTKDLGLHDHDGFKHFLNFVFSHVVFLLLVDGVATTTLAGGGVAFYLWGAL